jgi:hypothetical protein
MDQQTTRRHGCHNRKPFVDAVTVQDGWARARDIVGLLPIVTRQPRMKVIPDPMTKDCQYTLHAENHADPSCAGCTWKAQP